MATEFKPYTPLGISTSTTTITYTTTTLAACSVQVGNMTLRTNPKKTIAIPGLLPTSNRPADAVPTHLRITALPSKGSLLYPDGTEVTGSVPFNIAFTYNGRLSYAPSEEDFDSDDTFKIAVVTGCGTSNEATVTIGYIEPDSPCDCSGASNTSSTTSSTTTS